MVTKAASDSNFYSFDCGCSIPIDEDGDPQIDYENINLCCNKTWSTYAKGYTRSIFQLEKRLGKEWSKKLKPKSVLESAALISVIRPGTLNTVNAEGKSFSQVFCDRKNSNWKPEEGDKLSEALEETYGVNIYQEQTMFLSFLFAGFDGDQQIKLLKGIAKKDAGYLASLKEEFLNGCSSKGLITNKQALEVFSNIEASARYAFNKSHAVGYAKTGYWTAWVKSHLPIHYICGWLRHAKNTPKPKEEIKAIVSEANRLGVTIAPPSFKNLPVTNFFINKETSIIYFGIDSIKECGEKVASLIQKNITKPPTSFLNFLVFDSQNLKKNNIINFIRAGCFDYLQIDRYQAEHDYNKYSMLTKGEKKDCVLIQSKLNLTNLKDLLKKVLELSGKEERIKIIKSMIETFEDNLKDSKRAIIEQERELIGVNISYSSIMTNSQYSATHECGVIDDLPPNTKCIACGEVDEYFEIEIKNGKMAGQTMARFKLVDESGECDCVVFPKELDTYQGAIYETSNVMIVGSTGNRGGLIVNKIYEG